MTTETDVVLVHVADPISWDQRFDIVIVVIRVKSLLAFVVPSRFVNR